MNFSGPPLDDLTVWPNTRALNRDVITLSSDLLPLGDILTLLLSGYLSTLLYVTAFGAVAGTAWALFSPAVLVGALVGPFILYDKQFGSLASRAQHLMLMRGHVLRFALLAGVLSILGSVNPAWANLPGTWFGLWLGMSLFFTFVTRALLAAHVRRLEQRGVLREVIAIVGSGPIADRLVGQLQGHTRNVELLGVFDDKVKGAQVGVVARTGSVAELIELGKTRKIDWIVMTLPCTAEDRLRSIVQRLKALAVPIGLCPQNVGLTLPCHHIDYVSDEVPVTLLADRPIRRWGAVLKGGEDFVPRWIVTFLLLPLIILEAWFLQFRRSTSRGSLSQPVTPALTYHFDNHDLTGFTTVAAGFGTNRFGYVVTPNADHLIRLHEDETFRAHYAAAAYVLMDSRFLSKLLRITKGIALPVCTGSDLTARLFNDVIGADDGIVLIGGTVAQAQKLSAR